MTNEIRCSVEIREDAERGGPGRLFGTLLTYGERAADRPELFASGALSWPADGVVLRRQHVRAAPIMRVIPELRGAALVIDTALPDTSAGRDAAAEIRDGLFRGLSVEFQAERERRDTAGVRMIERGRLVGAGLVDTPSYAGSRVEVRKRRNGRRRVWL